MKTKIKSIGIFMIMVVFAAFTACNNTSKNNNEQIEVEVEKDNSIKELKEELKDVGQALDEAAEKEGEEFKAKAEEVIDNLNTKIDKFEANLEATGEEIDQETRDAIDDLKDKGNKLDAKLEKFGDETQEGMEDLRKEVKHDFADLGTSIKNLFKDNV